MSDDFSITMRWYKPGVNTRWTRLPCMSFRSKTSIHITNIFSDI